MAKALVLAEKPSVGRDLARVLGCNRKGNGFFEGDRHIVTWALGHLVTLADPEAYDKKYASWRIEDLPMLPEKMKLDVIKQTSGQYNTVKNQMARQDVNEIIIATDAGREGELVARWIIAKAGIKKPIRRLWISSVTDKAIKEGFSKLRDGREYENLYASAVARSEADWVVGINATRALTCKFNAQLSCGRVQTPTLAIIARREDEIHRFVPKPFWGIEALTNGAKLIWQNAQTKEIRTFDKDVCDGMLKKLAGHDVEITDIEKSLKKVPAPLLYDLTELQRDANRKFSFSAKETSATMQSLYETHKILTYPRTDSRYVTADIVDTIKERLAACGVGPYGAVAARLARNPIKASKSFVDDSKVSDHHAIIPTEQPVDLRRLSERERKVYDLVVRRFLAVLLPPFEYDQTTVRAKIGSEQFFAKGKVVAKQGWKEIYGHDAEEDDSEADANDIKDQLLPELHKGDKIKVQKLNQTMGKTKPPAYFTEATLLSAMENPAKYMAGESKELLKTIGETGGLGTVATRADIIEKLFKSFLIEQKGKAISVTSKGKQLLELVPTELKSPTLTAKWEQQLGLIAKGVLKKEAFIRDMRGYAQTAVTQIKNTKEAFKHDNMSRTKCPECGKYMLEVSGKKGRMLVCQDRECGSRIGLARISNARCPNCHKKMELRGDGEGQTFACSCGYREKLSAFQERRKDDTTKASKGDVATFLRDQGKKEEGLFNTAMAEALAKLQKQR